ncbi:MAG: hypothetical protein WAW39_08450 [Prosthecobacter sp.]|uniref:hypothetical protein n=1 Tax=Prosthecobacter sp. TaxID=1965333 RepID=UPI003BB108D1
MKALSLTLLTFLCLALSTQARIGESLDDCIKRYGEPAQCPQPKTLLFHKSGIAITCFFVDGHCVQISYKKLEPAARLNEREVEILRMANGSKWQLRPDDRHNPTIHWSNETCECQWDRNTGLLQFEALAEKKRKADEIRAAEKKLLEGF